MSLSFYWLFIAYWQYGNTHYFYISQIEDDIYSKFTENVHSDSSENNWLVETCPSEELRAVLAHERLLTVAGGVVPEDARLPDVPPDQQAGLLLTPGHQAGDSYTDFLREIIKKSVKSSTHTFLSFWHEIMSNYVKKCILSYKSTLFEPSPLQCGNFHTYFFYRQLSKSLSRPPHEDFCKSIQPCLARPSTISALSGCGTATESGCDCLLT